MIAESIIYKSLFFPGPEAKTSFKPILNWKSSSETRY